MNNMNKPHRKRKYFQNAQKILLGLAELTVDLILAFDRPYAFGFQNIRDLKRAISRQNNNLDSVNQSLRSLKSSGLVHLNTRGKVSLTALGAQRIFQQKIPRLKPFPQKWDHKWRIIIFDIPEKKRLGRDVLRAKIRELGCIQMQKSVWVTPYKVENQIRFLRRLYEIESYVQIILALEIENQSELLKRFKKLISD